MNNLQHDFRNAYDGDDHLRVYWYNHKGPQDGVHSSKEFNSMTESEAFYE